MERSTNVMLIINISTIIKIGWFYPDGTWGRGPDELNVLNPSDSSVTRLALAVSVLTPSVASLKTIERVPNTSCSSWLQVPISSRPSNASMSGPRGLRLVPRVQWPKNINRQKIVRPVRLQQVPNVSGPSSLSSRRPMRPLTLLDEPVLNASCVSSASQSGPRRPRCTVGSLRRPTRPRTMLDKHCQLITPPSLLPSPYPLPSPCFIWLVVGLSIYILSFNAVKMLRLLWRHSLTKLFQTNFNCLFFFFSLCMRYPFWQHACNATQKIFRWENFITFRWASYFNITYH